MASERLLVDTDVVSYLAWDRPEAKDFVPLLTGKLLFVSFATVGEMYFGAQKANWGRRRIAKMEAILERYTAVPGSIEIAQQYGRVKSAFEDQVDRFRLFERTELDPDWDPVDDQRLTVWEVLQYLVAALGRSESEAAVLLHTLGGIGDRARQLAYLFYQKANDKGWATEAGAYNRLICAWPNLQTHATATAAGATDSAQQTLIGTD